MDKFSLKYYNESILKGIKKGYIFTSCKNYDKTDLINEKTVLLRHDVDFNLENTLNIAKIEHDLNATSTFFIRLHAKNYNILEYNNINIIKNILSMGHEIGLHFEPDFYEKNYDGCISEWLSREVNFLSNLIGEKIVGASVHEPSRRGNIINNEVISKTSLKYESYLIPKTYKYISDSGGRWREGDLLEWINKDINKLYVNTHPVWWYNNTPLENY